MRECIITGKGIQAANLGVALGDTYGAIVPTLGPMLRLASPSEMKPQWSQWSAELLDPGPDGYRWVADEEASRRRGYDRVAHALGEAERVWIATHCDREGQLIAQTLIEHHGFTGEVRRAIFTFEDKAHLIEAFERATLNEAHAALGAAGEIRAQVDHIFNLSLTRSARVCLGGHTGVGRGRSPTLAIVVEREREIRANRKSARLEIVAEVSTGNEVITMTHPFADSGVDADIAQRAATTALGAQGSLSVEHSEHAESPPQPHSLPSLQRAASSGLGLTANRTLEVADALYEGHKLLSYPRTDARQLPAAESANARALLDGLDTIDALAGLVDPASPVIRSGEDGAYRNDGSPAHRDPTHALTVNPHACANLATRLKELTEEELAVFMLVARRVVATHMSTHRTINTTVSLKANGIALRAEGCKIVEAGWRESEDGDEEPGPARLGHLDDGAHARVSATRVQTHPERAPQRLSEGALAQRMRNAAEHESNPGVRAQLMRSQGIGTPATRGRIIRRLKDQKLLKLEGGEIAPTGRGEAVVEALEAACPELLSPVLSARFEHAIDAVARGEMTASDAIDLVKESTTQIIEALKTNGPQASDAARYALATATNEPGPPSPRALAFANRIALVTGHPVPEQSMTNAQALSAWIEANKAQTAPSAGAIKHARKIAAQAGLEIAAATLADARVLSAWVEDHAPARPPSDKAVAFARKIAATSGAALAQDTLVNAQKLSAWIDANRASARTPRSEETARAPTAKALAYAQRIAQARNIDVPASAIKKAEELTAWIAEQTGR